MAKTEQLYDKENNALQEWMIECPACKMPHSMKTHPNGGWKFDGNVDAPTFSPSLLVRFTRTITDEQHAAIMRGEKFKPKNMVCHSFIRNGQIQFLNDCTHSMAGQTVDLPEVE